MNGYGPSLWGSEWQWKLIVCGVAICAVVGFVAIIAGLWWLLSSITIVWGSP